MANVSSAKEKYANNTDEDSYNTGLQQFLQESDADSLQDAWVQAVQNADSYTGGVSDFLESEGGVEDANVTQDYNWENETLNADWEGNLGDAAENFASRTDDMTADQWFKRYASAFGTESE